MKKRFACNTTFASQWALSLHFYHSTYCNEKNYTLLNPDGFTPNLEIEIDLGNENYLANSIGPDMSSVNDN